MASLTGQQINNTYQALLKTTGNTSLPASGKVTMTDGAGNASPLSLSQTQLGINTGASGQLEISGDNITLTDSSVSTGFAITGTQMDFAGSIDFSGATVTGLPGGGGGLTSVSSTTQVSFNQATDFVYHSLLIPGGTFGAGDIVNFNSLFTVDDSGGGWIYYSAWIGTTTNLYADYPLGGWYTASGIPQMAVMVKSLYIYTSDGSGAGTAWMTDTTAIEQVYDHGLGNYADSNSRPINWNNDVYINYQAYVDNPTSSITHKGSYATKING